jgi:type IV pilus assembly protein PilP
MTFQTIYRGMACVIFWLFLIVGCGQEAEPPPAPKVVRQKIAVSQKDQTEARKKEPVKTQTAKQAPVVEVAVQNSKPAAGKIDLPATPAAAPVPAGEATPKPDGSETPTVEAKATATELAVLTQEELETKEQAEEKEEEMIDPFAPLFKDEPVVKKQLEEKAETARRIPLTPLEKIDLGQLKLVAIVKASSGNKALVEEGNGKGYIVTRGTYIGINSGRIIEIFKDRIVIEEEIEDLLGKVTISRRELTLQKPPGEF